MKRGPKKKISSFCSNHNPKAPLSEGTYGNISWTYLQTSLLSTKGVMPLGVFIVVDLTH